MPRLPKKTSRPRRKAARKPRKAYKKPMSQNMAKITDTQLSGGKSSYVVQTDTAENFNHLLIQYPRAMVVAAAYQEFKIDYIEVRIKPYFDTYSAGVSTTASATGVITKAPQLYKMILKNGEYAPTDVNWFRANGVNAITLAKDRNITFRYKPSVLMVANTNNQPGAGVPAYGTIKVSPWLSTKLAQSTVHYGIGMLFDSQEFTALIANVGQVEIEGHFSFRKPNYTGSTAGTFHVNGDEVSVPR